MRRRRLVTVPVIAFLIFGSSLLSPVFAHRLDVRVYLINGGLTNEGLTDGEPVDAGLRVQVQYDDGAVAQGARVEVYADEWRLASGIVDRDGSSLFRTSSPQSLRIVAVDGQGHRAEVFLFEENLRKLFASDPETLDRDKPIASSEDSVILSLGVGGTRVLKTIAFVALAAFFFYANRRRRKHASS